MSQGPETTFINSVHRHLPADFYRMKNHNQYNGGIADCWYSGVSGDLWVEYKFLSLPKRQNTLISLVDGKNPPLSRLQQQWLCDRKKEGRNVFVIVGAKNGGVIFTSPEEWAASFTAQQFTALLMDRKAIAGRIFEFCTEGAICGP